MFEKAVRKSSFSSSPLPNTFFVSINNVSKPVDDIHHQICSFVAGNGGNSATTDINDSYQNNVITGLNGSPCLYDNDRIYWSCSNNKCNTDPGYVNATPGAAGDVNGNSVGGTWIPGNSNFAITGSSPANNYVVSPAPSWMPAQNVDAGACHHSLTTCPNPGTTNY